MVRQSYGGVGRNIADCLSRLGHVPLFISTVGQDVAGTAFVEQFKHMVYLLLLFILFNVVVATVE